MAENEPGETPAEAEPVAEPAEEPPAEISVEPSQEPAAEGAEEPAEGAEEPTEDAAELVEKPSEERPSVPTTKLSIKPTVEFKEPEKELDEPVKPLAEPNYQILDEEKPPSLDMPEVGDVEAVPEEEAHVTDVHRESHISQISSPGAVIDYDHGPRYKEELYIDTLSTEGDIMRHYSMIDILEESSQSTTTEEVVEEEDLPKIDREAYYARHAVLSKLLDQEKVKNFVLQKKLGIFFKRRKMDYVLKETDQRFDTEEKYAKKLETYEELLEIDRVKRETITRELNFLKDRKETKARELHKLFQEMQHKEKDTGSGLINTKTGNPIPDKVVERLISRQKTLMEEVCSMRLKFIHLKDIVAEKNEAIASLDKVAENLFLMDYEQLKVENRNYVDKIEERDDDLTKLRYKCQNTIQVLAHIREKSAALESDIEDLQADMASVEVHTMQIREQLSAMKQERDYYRQMTNKLRTESGLLTEPDLLRDMEESMIELKERTEQLEQLQKENQIKAQQIRNIRRNIEEAIADGGEKKKPRQKAAEKKRSAVAKPTVCRGRPSLLEPELPEDAFQPLMEIKPVPKHMMRDKKACDGPKFKYRELRD